MSVTCHWKGSNFKVPQIRADQSVLNYLLCNSFTNLKTGGDFDFASKFGKINLPWPGKKYPGEKHVFGHNYTGVGTRLDIRLDENDQPESGEEPKNRIDLAAYHHDIKYRDAKNDLQLKHKADREMLKELDNIQNPSTAERFQRMLVKKALQAKLKLGMGFYKVEAKPIPRKSKQEAIETLYYKKPKIDKVINKIKIPRASKQEAIESLSNKKPKKQESIESLSNKQPKKQEAIESLNNKKQEAIIMA